MDGGSWDEAEALRRRALKTLGLPDSGDMMPKMRELEAAWKRAAVKYHPDKTGGDEDGRATARFRASREAFELLRADLRSNRNYLSGAGRRQAAAASSSAWFRAAARREEHNPFDDARATAAERQRRQRRRERYTEEYVIKEKEYAKGNSERFLRTKQRAVLARAIRVSEVLSRSVFLNSPYLFVADAGALALLVGTATYLFQ